MRRSEVLHPFRCQLVGLVLAKISRFMQEVLFLSE